jgi:uncharacterized protein YecE (DUF72 family)
MDQLDLFSAPSTAHARGPLAAALEREHAAAREIADRLPSGIRFGTSSWSFPGWAGLVYSRQATAATLAREGLCEYARHPLLRTVGIDRSFYAPVPVADLARYAEQLPPGFPCCMKAPEAVTAIVRTGKRSANPGFLDPVQFVRDLLDPVRRCFAEHAGPFLLQLPPAPPSLRPDPSRFADSLDRFLSALPRDFTYAVELRDPSLLTADYAAVLDRHGAAHVYNYATAMPMPGRQSTVAPLATASFIVVRLLLRPGTGYEDRREEFLPFDHIVDESPEMRVDVVSLARRALDLGRTVFVLVNNKAEGCSPATIRALATMLAGNSTGPVSP